MIRDRRLFLPNQCAIHRKRLVPFASHLVQLFVDELTFAGKVTRVSKPTPPREINDKLHPIAFN
jgi:hypothetical protein